MDARYFSSSGNDDYGDPVSVREVIPRNYIMWLLHKVCTTDTERF
jgi:hypothetical protein